MEPDPRHRMTPTQAFFVSNVLRRRRLTISELAELTHVSLAAASQMVDRLVARGFARRRPSEMDGRCVIVETTAHGAWALSLCTAAMRRSEATWRDAAGGASSAARVSAVFDSAEESQRRTMRTRPTPFEPAWLGTRPLDWPATIGVRRATPTASDSGRRNRESSAPNAHG